MKIEPNVVTLESGETVKAKHVVVTCGPKSLGFYPKQGYKAIETETFTMSDKSGLPPMLREELWPIYALPDGEELQ